MCVVRWRSWNRGGPRGTFLGRTDESDEVIVGTAAGIEFTRSFRRRTSNKQWERDAFTTFIGVPWNPRGLAVVRPQRQATGGDTSQRRSFVSMVKTPGCAACLGTASQTHSEVPGEVPAVDQPECRGRSSCNDRPCKGDPAAPVSTQHQRSSSNRQQKAPRD